ncbi:Cationic amino acid transporter 3 [Cichlidogyrus casuarinus]|uniref:Cationic amino acid transporter 3 n=1 Tax=Cichlidogyrus casuarinus TaxID=1844966 RepID=A0ABD2QCQ8_9PLAT
MSGERISQSLKQYMPMNVVGLAEYPDFVAAGIVLVISVTESALMANTFTCINCAVLVVIFVTSMIKADIKNWQVDPRNVTDATVGAGGFFPYGLNGVLKGITYCFFALVGFETISSASSEALNPARDIPVSVIICVSFCFLVSTAIALSLTLIMPYYLIPNVSPLSTAFVQAGLPQIMYVVSVGAFCACTSTLMGGIFSISRVVYSMADDGLIFKFLAKIHSKTKAPHMSLLVTGVVTAIIALLFDQNRLIDLTSVAILLAYCSVAVSVNVLRYQRRTIASMPQPVSVQEIRLTNFTTTTLQYKDHLEQETDSPIMARDFLKLCFFPINDLPDANSERIAHGACYLLLIIESILSIGVHLVTLDNPTTIHYAIGGVMIVFGAVFFVILTLIQWRQPQNSQKVSFMVPLVPIIPNLSQLVNLLIVVKSDTQTWIMYFVFIIPSMFIYFFYGMRHSREAEPLHTDRGQ